VAARAGLLTIDGGNSTISCRLGAHALGLDVEAADVRPRIAAFAGEHGADRVIAVTVVERTAAVLDAVAAAARLPLRLVGRDVACPLPLRYRTPSTLGPDRWLGALAAHRAHGRAITVDCGSATTVNLIEADGTFCGGAIGPGLRAFVAGMAAVTPALPAADLDGDPEVPGGATDAAITAGVLLGYAGLVERLVADTQRAAGGPATVVLTGGNAERLRRHSRLRAIHVPDLVHRGLTELDSCGS